MKKQLFVLGMASVFALTGCYGTKKVEFAKFKEEVDKLESVEVKAVKITGKYDGTKVNLTYEFAQTAGQGLDALIDGLTGKYNEAEEAGISVAVAAKTPAMYAIAEDSKCEYFVGMGFKVKGEGGAMEWAKNGLLASYKAKDDKHSCSYTFSWKK